jgi:hypothetical protein
MHHQFSDDNLLADAIDCPGVPGARTDGNKILALYGESSQRTMLFQIWLSDSDRISTRIGDK